MWQDVAAQSRELCTVMAAMGGLLMMNINMLMTMVYTCRHCVGSPEGDGFVLQYEAMTDSFSEVRHHQDVSDAFFTITDAVDLRARRIFRVPVKFNVLHNASLILPHDSFDTL
jgi:hypothetical protein